MTCRYITTLDRPCGRTCTGGLCDFHHTLSQLDSVPLEYVGLFAWTNHPILERVRLRLAYELETSK